MNTQRARSLRATMTDAERALWQALRRKQLDAFRFRRQQPIGPYVADFYCAIARLVIEVDGGQHTGGIDAARDAWLAARGYRVLRFWNNDVLGNIEGVVAAIRLALEESRRIG
jgi:very-short-patch-repair endonuclease